MILLSIGLFVGFLIGRTVYKPPGRGNKLNTALFAREIFPKRK